MGKASQVLKITVSGETLCCGVLKTRSYAISLPFILPTQHLQTKVAINSPSFCESCSNSVSIGGGESKVMTDFMVLPQTNTLHLNHHRITQGRAPS